MISPATEKVIKALRKSKLSVEDRTALTATLLDKLQALPIKDSIVIRPDAIIINGKQLDVEQFISFKDSCIVLKDNYARQIVTEQIKYLAINIGIHNGLTPDTILFAKAALWCLQQEQELLDKIV